MDPNGVSRGSKWSLTWIQMESHVDPNGVSRGSKWSLTWIQMESHVDPNGVSRGSKWSLMWIQMESHVDPNGVSDCSVPCANGARNPETTPPTNAHLGVFGGAFL